MRWRTLLGLLAAAALTLRGISLASPFGWHLVPEPLENATSPVPVAPAAVTVEPTALTTPSTTTETLTATQTGLNASFLAVSRWVYRSGLSYAELVAIQHA